MTFSDRADLADVRTKMNRAINRVVDVRNFGAVGDGVTDDTAAIVSAFASGGKYIKGHPGHTYLIDGGLSSSADDLTLDFTGCAIKLKDNAANPRAVTLSGKRCKVIGGYWDGNKANGNTPADLYTSFGVLLNGNNSSIHGSRFHNFAGMGVKMANADNLFVDGVEVTGTDFYGIYGEATTQNCLHWKVRACYLDTSGAGSDGQGILLTSNATYDVQKYEVTGNTVKGPTGSIAEQAINIAVRGNDGVISGNITYGGSMGFSEGGENCVISGNSFLALAGSVRYGIEPTGQFSAVGNVVTDAYRGIICSGARVFDGSVISGNVLKCASGSHHGVYIQPDSGYSADKICISGNTIEAHGAVYSQRQCDGLSILGNAMIGPGSGSGGSAVYVNTPSAAAHVSVIGNSISGYARAYSAYAASALTITDLFAASNYTNNGVSSVTSWFMDGSAVAGARVQVLGISGSPVLNRTDQAGVVFEMASTSYNNPESFLTAGVGSIHRSLNSNGGAYYKKSGTGNTGWAVMNE